MEMAVKAAAMEERARRRRHGWRRRRRRILRTLTPTLTRRIRSAILARFAWRGGRGARGGDDGGIGLAPGGQSRLRGAAAVTADSGARARVSVRHAREQGGE